MVKTLVEFSGVPKNTTGIMVEELDVPFSKEKIWKVTWDLPRSKPLSDWFDEYEVKKYLQIKSN